MKEFRISLMMWWEEHALPDALLILFIIVGLCIIAGGVVPYYIHQNKMETYTVTYASITNREERKWTSTDDDGHTTTHYAYYLDLDYYANEELYQTQVRLDYNPSTEVFTLRYNPEDPTDYVYEKDLSYVWIMCLIGSIFSIAGLLFMIIFKKIGF